MDLRYLLLAGVWLGPVKPDAFIILQPILDRVHTMYEQGISLSTPAGPKCLRAKLLCCVFDLPARAMALNMSQWNGHYGCTYCLDEGTQVSHVRIYLPDDEHTVRTDKQILQYAQEASGNSPKFGVKGSSVLSPYLNIVKDTAIDYMHAVLEGVVKTILCSVGSTKIIVSIFLRRLKKLTSCFCASSHHTNLGELLDLWKKHLYIGRLQNFVLGFYSTLFQYCFSFFIEITCITLTCL